MRILVIENDVPMANAVAQECREAGWAPDVTQSGVDGLNALAATDYDVAVVAAQLPDMSGAELCEMWRDRSGQTPILLLGEATTWTARVAGLDAGADDFVQKPFVMAELIARMRALSRRPLTTLPVELRCADVTLRPAARTAYRAGVAIRLTTKEFALLEYFLRNPHRVISRPEIRARLWGGNGPNSNTIDSLVARLRRRIHLGDMPPLLHTVRSAGYMFTDRNEP